MIDPQRDRRRQAEELAGPADEARELAERLGLDGMPVRYWVVDHDQMNEVIAYEGFQTRYPHWRWGMKYERQQKQDQFLGGKAFEIVNHDDPAHAFLQASNSTADQKAVITHVEAHADFFANNQWFGLFADRVDAATMLERHARRISEYMADPEIGRETVERWIDNVLPLMDTIDQHRTFEPVGAAGEADGDGEAPPGGNPIEALELSSEVERAVREDGETERAETATDGETDLIGYLRRHGKQYDAEEKKAVEMSDWQKDVLDMLRAEAYYFAPQKMTKLMNEGWASFWESIMMAGEGFAGDDEFLEYADHLAQVLGSPGVNPYRLGKALWEHIENTTNRREVVEALLRVEGITWRNFHEEVDFEAVLERLEPAPALAAITPETLDDLAALDGAKVDHDALERARAGELDVGAAPWKVLTYEGLAERHFSLVKPHNRNHLPGIERDELERIARYLFDDERYPDVETALADVDRTAGWDRMFDVRESHNDVTFLDEFLTPEFVRENGYFTYEYNHAEGQNQVASTDPADVKRKLLLEFTNFGKPRITVGDGNFNNRNELLLRHEYNGVPLDVEQAGRLLERVFELWGRPVNLKTIVKEYPEGGEPRERGLLIRYDGEELTEQALDWADVEDIAAEGVDYDTKPDDWL